MNAITVTVAVPVTDSGLHILDQDRRTFMALSRDESYWHLIRPVRAEDPGVAEGNVREGDLTCSCLGGVYRGDCYRIRQAEAFEREMAEAAFWAEPGTDHIRDGALGASRPTGERGGSREAEVASGETKPSLGRSPRPRARVLA